VLAYSIRVFSAKELDESEKITPTLTLMLTPRVNPNFLHHYDPTVESLKNLEIITRLPEYTKKVYDMSTIRQWEIIIAKTRKELTHKF
jgi:hypothetical protein